MRPDDERLARICEYIVAGIFAGFLVASCAGWI
jgi:hypothetical protein